MQRYTLYCTEEQTRKALELGAPLEYHCPSEREKVYHRPTAEQMINYLIESGIKFKFSMYWSHVFWKISKGDWYYCNTCHNYTEATLGAIDAALDYLMQQKDKNL